MENGRENNQITEAWAEQEKERIILGYIAERREGICEEVLSLCLPVMKKFCAAEVKRTKEGSKETAVSGAMNRKTLCDAALSERKGWLKRVYQFCVSEYFPGNFSGVIFPGQKEACRWYLEVLAGVLKKERENSGFDPCRDFALLTEEELKSSYVQGEYRHFLSILEELKLPEFMRVAAECTPFDTLGHIAGVHHVAMYVARQLSEHTDVEIDLGLMSAAALIHDVGKFGCRAGEAGRVPYLHYYYTQQFSERFGLSNIGHIAANHSVWDLELENLSAENLLLIYADFRVKSVREENGKEKICFWTLDDSYRIILDKLDNVDDKKRLRYQKVFQKLKDFENFLHSLGVCTDLKGDYKKPEPAPGAALLDDAQVRERMRYLAIRSNIMVMNTVGRPAAFAGLLEEAKGEKDWRNVRSYLNVLEEYSAYLTCGQKDMILSFLYEMLMHRDGDIRRQAARIMGKLIAGYEIRYQKEVPEGAPVFVTGRSLKSVWRENLRLMLSADQRITQQHRRWIGYAMKGVFTTAMEAAEPDKRKEILEELLLCYKETGWESLAEFLLMDCACEITPEECPPDSRQDLEKFACNAFGHGDLELKTAALRFLCSWMERGWQRSQNLADIYQECRDKDGTIPVCLQYLIAKASVFPEVLPGFYLEKYQVSQMLLENQRMDTPWIFKQTNLEILSEYYRSGRSTQIFQWAAHLTNMLQVSDRIVIRHQAGRYLTEIMPELTEAQRYEIAAELTGGLETGEYSVSRYIPAYLGRIFFSLEPAAQEELLKRFRAMINGTSEKVAIVTLETIGIVLQHIYDSYHAGGEYGKFRQKQKEQLEGLLFRGMTHCREEVRQEAFYIIGHHIFGSSVLTPEQKEEYFSSMGKKMLTLMKRDRMIFYLYNNAAALNHIYRFLSDYAMEEHSQTKKQILPAAFFPGTFDPFSRGHKEVVKKILSLGYEVYLALDEFSWSKRTQPYKIRQRIMEMSVADLKNVYLFPAEIPVNIANPDSLRRLREIFGERELFIVVGSDVVLNASAYKGERRPYSIHSFPHIILQRNTRQEVDEAFLKTRIDNKILSISIQEKGETISSTRIRENLEKNRDISSLVDSGARNYIYEKNLYVREPMYRTMTGYRPVGTSLYLRPEEGILRELSGGMVSETEKISADESAVLIRDKEQGRKILGCLFFHPLMLRDFYREFKREELVLWLRKNVSGRICVITGIFGDVSGVEDDRQTVLSEFFAWCLKEEYSYVLCRKNEKNQELLKRQGFTETGADPEWMLVDVRRPVVLFADAGLCMKQPFGGDPEMKNRILFTRKKLQKALTSLYPGKLVLTLDSYIINYRLVSLITKAARAPAGEEKAHTAGEKMCVPCGKILKGVKIPGTVVKELNTEKVYTGDMKEFEIREYPDYASLEIQLRTIKAFGRPVLLVDNLYHRGYRMNFITPWMRKEKVEVSKVIVSVLTGVGRDLAEAKGTDLDCVYFIPNMRTWFIESDFYPFIGGDSIRTGREEAGGMLPSVNPVLPYQIPAFLQGIPAGAFYNLSEICLENAEELLVLLEKLYQKQFGRKLTIARLGEVLVQSRYPDAGGAAPPAPADTASGYLKKEQERLKRMNHFGAYGMEGDYRI